jgi:hypothetical protein
MSMIVKASQGIAVIAAVWIGYNMLIFAEIAAGAHVKYIPYLHFPIKLLVNALS